MPPVTRRSAVRKSRRSPSVSSVSGVRRSRENATAHGGGDHGGGGDHDDAFLADPGDRMLTARSGPLGLGVPRTLGPAEGSDHLFLLPERALVMDSTHLRQDLAGLDFNLHLNLLHTAPRGNVWLCELLTDGWDRERVKRFFGGFLEVLGNLRGNIPRDPLRYAMNLRLECLLMSGGILFVAFKFLAIF